MEWFLHPSGPQVIYLPILAFTLPVGFYAVISALIGESKN